MLEERIAGSDRFDVNTALTSLRRDGTKRCIVCGPMMGNHAIFSDVHRFSLMVIHENVELY